MAVGLWVGGRRLLLCDIVGGNHCGRCVAGGRKGAKFEEAFWREGSAGDFEIIWRERSIARRF